MSAYHLEAASRHLWCVVLAVVVLPEQVLGAPRLKCRVGAVLLENLQHVVFSARLDPVLDCWYVREEVLILGDLALAAEKCFELDVPAAQRAFVLLAVFVTLIVFAAALPTG